jgi:hypothetical protein
MQHYQYLNTQFPSLLFVLYCVYSLWSSSHHDITEVSLSKIISKILDMSVLNWFFVQLEMSWKNTYTRFYQKVPGLGQKKNAGLTYSILAAISFKIVSLGTYTAIP